MFEISSEFFNFLLQGVISALAVSSLASLILYLARAGRNLKYSHSVAVMGYPRSGKTTLIVTLIHKIISSRIARNFRVTGDETMEKVTAYHNMIVRGVNIGPTGDADTFLYRFQYDRAEPNVLVRLLSKRVRTYDIAIGDFPGEYTSDASSNVRIRRRRRKPASGTQQTAEVPPASARQALPPVSRPRFGRLYDPEYHSWVSQADKYIIIVDSADLVRRNLDASELTTQIYSAVVYLKESSLEDSKSLHEKPVALVFTKCDLLSNKSVNLENIDKINFKMANKAEFDPALYQQAMNILQSSFSQTIEMLENNFKEAKVIFHSSYKSQPTFDDASREIIEFIVP